MSQSAPSSYILRNMAEVANPDSVSLIPQTLGWLLLLVIILLVLSYVVTKRYLNYRMNQYRREALAILQHNQHNEKRDLMCYQVLTQVSHYLYLQQKKYPQQKKQFGQAWLDYLNRQCAGKACFQPELSQAWLNHLVGGNQDFSSQDSQAIFAATEQWLSAHRVPQWLSEQWNFSVVVKRGLSRLTLKATSAQGAINQGQRNQGNSKQGDSNGVE
ncbi:DUF4381 domain-containing protein [Vibrio hippocampi]|uniref:DUF4381 domain-containing protein n=1 Tax=Vibrio hippocampi TaxID=654686 RepID=A0ABN8DLK1_9VIBR|nr:DUF4381 domain-containing protein [Vibrio hippocampi]CAH0529653.1 hypothetical protein VHP8226_03408 [Vibrio hippocampi]